MIAILADIRSVHNVGSIFRTANGAGIEKIYLCGITPTPVDELGRVRADFTKTALGAERDVLWEYAKNTTRLVARLRRNGWLIIALEQDSRADCYTNLRLMQRQLAKTALLLGNERMGISLPLLNAVDRIIDIPMRGTKESLNVSVVFGIAAYHLLDECPPPSPALRGIKKSSV